MLSFGSLPDKYSFPCVIKACGALNNVRLGRLVHDTIRLLGFEFDVFAGSFLVMFYEESRCIDNARCLFDKLSQRDCVLCNVMLNGYVIRGESENAIRVFKEMRSSERKPNSLTFAGILSLCATEAMIDLGIQLHGSVVYFRLPDFSCSYMKHFCPAIYVDCILWDAFYTSDYTAQVLLGYCMVYIFMQTFMIPGTVFMSLLAGALFGVFKGVALVVFTATAGWISSWRVAIAGEFKCENRVTGLNLTFQIPMH
ncbi:hypothetical protein Q3G72_019546 [Acer saccharum]|nr:hypothetical protein Q3G72_019546 [Acer saccharum]